MVEQRSLPPGDTALITTDMGFGSKISIALRAETAGPTIRNKPVYTGPRKKIESRSRPRHQSDVIVLVYRPVKGIEISAELNCIDVLFATAEGKVVENRIDANHAIRSVETTELGESTFDDAFSNRATAGAVTATCGLPSSPPHAVTGR